MSSERWLQSLLSLALTLSLAGCSRDREEPATEAPTAQPPAAAPDALVWGPDRPDERPTQAAPEHTHMAGETSTSSAHQSPNRLIHEKSPYLLQHAYNPVDWFPWGEEAFAAAKAADKPIFLSSGYSTCHWCHVMERESFEDPEIAEMMNRWFISIKVDREELPDVDHVYMNAVTMLTGRGGWPLTVFLTPDRKPFFGGTYFPPEQRFNTPGMKQLLPQIAEAWKEKRDEIVHSADEITATLKQQLIQEAPPGTLSDDLLHGAFTMASNQFDPSHGGFGSAPKFPRSHELSFLLSYWKRTQTAQALEMATTTLDHLAHGGIHDHLGGGFHRYSTDARWLVPHFEKMLYDQALLARSYLEASRITGRSEYAQVARGIFEYVLRDLTDPQGGLYTAEDADSEGVEGKFYVWTPAEVVSVLGAEEAELFNRFYDVTDGGNFEQGASILNIEQPLEAFATLKGIDAKGVADRLTEARSKLLAVRSRRVRPHRDDKILTSWNGLMIASFAYGAATLNEPRYLEAAQRAADFILANVRREATLLRRYREGEAIYTGTLEDYAFFSYGLLELYEAGFDPRYLAEAKGLAEQMVDRFWDEAGGGFFMRDREQQALIAQSKEIYDGAIPSGNSVAALVLLRIGRLTADERLEGIGRRTLETFAQSLKRMPFSYTQMLIAVDFALGPSQEVVIAGERNAGETSQMLRALHERFLPRTVVILHPTGEGRDLIESLAPYIKSQDPIRGQTAAYVCENYVCNLPTTDVAKFVSLLEQPRGQ